MAKLLSEQTAQRLLHLLNSRDTGAARRGGGAGGPLWSFVRCDSDTAVGGDAILDQCYPATILRPASDFPAPPEEMAGVLLTVLGADGAAVAPVAGMPYPCLLAGEVESDRSGSGAGTIGGRRRAFSVAIPVTPDDGDDTGDTSGGSGTSDDGCGRAVATATFENTDGVLKLTAKRLDVANDNGRLILKECDTSTTQYTVGPRSPTTPGGTTTTVVNQVCPVFTTLNYTDADGNPASIRVVTSVKAKRKVLVAAIVDDPGGCIESDVDACCGGGSGSGDPEKCVSGIAECPDGTSAQLTLSFGDGSGDITTLYHVRDPDDGNDARYLSQDGTWDLRFDTTQHTYLLTNLDTGFVWFAGDAWECGGANILTPVDPTQPVLQTDPVFDCTHGVGYVCVDGTCYEVPESLADFASLHECEAACPEGSGSGSGSCTTAYTPGVCCSFVDGNTVTAAFATTIPGVGASYALTWAAGQFKYDDATPGARVAAIRLSCAAGSWTLDVAGVCDDLVTPFHFAIVAEPTCCGPFRWAGTTTSEDGCFNGTLVTATVTG
jgi:hypothetical protein